MALPSENNRFEAAIRESLEREVAEARETIIAEAVAEFERECRKRVAMVAIEISRYFSVQHMSNNVLITIHDKPVG